MAKLEPVELDDRYAKLKKLVSDLQERYNDSRMDESEDGKRLRAGVAGQLRRLSHDHIHPGEEYIEADFPTAIDGSTFRINDREYVGKMTVPACEFAYIMWMIDQNRKVDLDRMRESGRTIDLGDIMQRARIIQREN